LTAQSRSELAIITPGDKDLAMGLDVLAADTAFVDNLIAVFVFAVTNLGFFGSRHSSTHQITGIGVAFSNSVSFTTPPTRLAPGTHAFHVVNGSVAVIVQTVTDFDPRTRLIGTANLSAGTVTHIDAGSLTLAHGVALALTRHADPTDVFVDLSVAIIV